MGYTTAYSYRVSKISKEILKEKLPKDFDYAHRLELVDGKIKEKQENLKKRRKQLLSKIESAKQYTYAEFSKVTTDLSNYIPSNYKKEHSSNIKDSYEVLLFLLKRGYIDENYYMYISIFQEGRMSPNDMKFLISVKNGNALGYFYSLNGLETLVNRLDMRDFDNPAIINKDLLNFCLSNEKILAQQAEKIISQIAKNENFELDLLYAWDFDEWPHFIALLYNERKSLLKEVFDDVKRQDSDKLEFVLLLFHGCSLDEIENLDSNRDISKHINASEKYPVFFSGLSLERRNAILEKLNLEVIHLKDDSQSNDALYPYFYEHDLYVFNRENVRIIFAHEHIDGSKIDTAIYTSILESGIDQLCSYIHAAIDSFVESLVLRDGNNQESSDAMVRLLNSKELKQDVKEKLIKHNQTEINACRLIDDVVLYELLYQEAKVLVSEDNINDYIERFIGESTVLDAVFEKYLNHDVIRAINLFANMQDVCEATKRSLLLILDDSNINKDILLAIYGNVNLKGIWKQTAVKMNVEMMKELVGRNILPISPDIYSDVIETQFSTLAVEYLCGNAQKVIDNFSHFEINDFILSCLLHENSLENVYGQIIGRLQNCDINSEKMANNLLLYFTNIKSIFIIPLFVRAIEASTDKKIMCNALASCLSRNVLPVSSISGIIAKMGTFFAPLLDKGKSCCFDNSEYMDNLLYALYQVGYVRKPRVKRTSNQIFVFVKGAK